MTVGRALAAAAAIVATLGTAPASGQQRARTAGRSIAALSGIAVQSRQGTRIPLGSRIQPGKPTLISIWASWCLPCLVEAPHLNELRRRFAGRYNFIYVNRREGDVDFAQPPGAIAQFLARAGMADVDYVTADPAAYAQIVGADMRDIPAGRVGIPRIYLFDAAGRQVHTAYGYDDADGPDLVRRLNQVVTR